MKMIMAVDPGMSTGVVWGTIEENHPFMRQGYAQIPGGLEGVKRWWSGVHPQILVCEKFKTRPMARNYRLDELEPIRIEGWLDAQHANITWQYPEQRSLTSEGVKASEQILKAKGLWLVPSQIDGEGDADDVNAAQLHLLAYLRNVGHTPSIEAYLL